jgi:threonine synthase
MDYISTRGRAPVLDFEKVLLAGLADDGGLYLPQNFPVLPNTSGSYQDIAQAVMTPFIGDALSAEDFSACIAAAYATFTDPAIAPLRQLEENLFLMELFHGPTLAFKDVALQLLGQLYTKILKRSGRRVTIVGATSGDTGSAAIEAFKNSPHADIFILLPHGRVSDVQRRQMTTVDASNVHVIGIDGSFDDCQDLVKALFADHKFRDRVSLSAVNSINWARIMAQIVYYVTAAHALPGRKISFAVPTGNFGNAYAGHVARMMGLPMEPMLIASNANDVMTRTFEGGAIELHHVVTTLSPAMDIQVSSNFERYLFELYEADGKNLAKDMLALRKTGKLALGPARHAIAREDFQAARISDTATLQMIGDAHKKYGIIIDPHTAVALAASQKVPAAPDVTRIVLASAHPAKFPGPVLEATGIHPDLPPNLADLMHRVERITQLPADITQLKKHITERVPK